MILALRAKKATIIAFAIAIIGRAITEEEAIMKKKQRTYTKNKAKKIKSNREKSHDLTLQVMTVHDSS